MKKRKRSVGRPSDRKIRVLDYLMGGGILTISRDPVAVIQDINEIVDVLNIPLSICYRVIKDLKDDGLVIKIAKCLYAINIVDEKNYSEAVRILKEKAADLEGTYLCESLKKQKRWESIIEKQDPFKKEIFKLLRAEKGPKEFLMRYSVDDRVKFAKMLRSLGRSPTITFGAKSRMSQIARKAGVLRYMCEVCGKLLLSCNRGTLVKMRLKSGSWSLWLCPSCQKLWVRFRNN